MDFFEEQDKARSRTRLLVFYFVLAMLATGAGIYGVFALSKAFYLIKGGAKTVDFWDPSVFGTVVGITSLIIVIGSLTKSAQLRGGGAVVAREMGGRPIDPTTSDVHERMVLNVVEEMAIASGMPAPQVWVMDQEAGINAFAAGTEPGNAVVGLTRGCIERLSRDELQGVIAHEFSHILNGDMKLNMRLIGWIFGILMISMMGRGMMRMMYYSGGGSSRGGRDNGLPLLVIGLLIWLVGSIGEMFGRMIQAAISRQREFLADASAVQFTRNPDGLASALRKIGGKSGDSKLRSTMAGEASHMFFAGTGLFSWGMATHPPLPLRIKKLIPSWDGSYIDKKATSEKQKRNAKPQKRRAETEAFDMARAGVVLSALGESAAQNSDVGSQIYDSLEPEWIDAAHDRMGAKTLIYGLLMAQDGRRREEVLYLQKTVGSEVAKMAVQWSDELQNLHSSYKIALIDVALPTLRRLSYPEYQHFIEATRWMIASDAKVDLFEFMLQRMVARHLSRNYDRHQKPRIKYETLSSLHTPVMILISTISGVSGDSAAAGIAYQAAAEGYSKYAELEPTRLPPEKCGLSQISDALDECALATFAVRKQLVQVCGKAVMADTKVTSREAELLRSIADAIGVPVPPFVDYSKIA